MSKQNTFSAGQVIVAAQHNSNFDIIYADYNGNITNANIAVNAAIVYSKLNLSGSILLADIATSLKSYLMPSGVIVMWSGTIATIPTGWYLCNGSNGTPDLRNRFIVAADADDSGVAKSTITGSALQTSDTGVMPAHAHAGLLNQANSTYGVNAGGVSKPDVGSGSTSSYGTGTQVIAVFYALAYIMKS